MKMNVDSLLPDSIGNVWNVGDSKIVSRKYAHDWKSQSTQNAYRVGEISTDNDTDCRFLFPYLTNHLRNNTPKRSDIYGIHGFTVS